MTKIHAILKAAVAAQASDVHLKLGQRPFFRVAAELRATDMEPLTESELGAILAEILPAHLMHRYQEHHEADFSYFEDGVGRFRVNVFKAQGIAAFAMRYVKPFIPSFSELNLPESLQRIAQAVRGIVIVSGVTGSGKSTTLAAMLQYINQLECRRIITVEDPIEYIFADSKSVITQREVGLDTLSFLQALKHVIRQDPDVIMIGELRDQESFRTALAAAETGHLVLTTLHSSNAAVAFHRILEFFPQTERDQARLALASNLHAIICQRLMPASQGGVVPAVEILINTPTVRKLIEKDRLDVMSAAIETGVEDGMQSFNQSIYKLIKSGTVSEETGMAYASNPSALQMNLKGIFLDEDRRILNL